MLILFVSLQQYATFHAPGITNDSKQYISAAQSFLETGIFLDKDGNYYRMHTPLHPLVLSLGIDYILRWASILNMGCLVAALWIMFWLGEQLLHHPMARWLYQGSLALGTPVLLVGNFVWSEPLFLLLLSIIWWLLYCYYQQPSTHYLGWLIITTNLLCLQRNAGIFFFFVVMVIILLKQQRRHAFLYAALGIIGFAGWNVYVYLLTAGSHNIAHQAYFLGFGKGILQHVPALAVWFFPGKWGIPLFLILVMGAFIFTYWSYKKKRWQPLQIGILCFIPGVIITYIAFMAAMWWEVDPWETERYLAVVYPLGMLAVGMVWDKLYAELGSKSLKLFLVVISMLWLCYPIARTVKNVMFWHEVNKNNKEVVGANHLCLFK